jgi:hypothetical protein
LGKKCFSLQKILKMKKIILAVAVLFTISAKAQITKDSLLKVMSKEACEDLNKKDLSKVDASNIESEFSMILMPTLMSHTAEIESVYGGGMTDEATMKKLGTDLSLKLAFSCPKFMELSMKMMGKKPVTNTKKNPERTEEISAENETLGTLLTVNAGDISTLSIKDGKGKIVKFYWLEYFENADVLLANNRKYLNKKVRINYTEKFVFDAAKKDYKAIKVITSIDLQ